MILRTAPIPASDSQACASRWKGRSGASVSTIAVLGMFLGLRGVVDACGRLPEDVYRSSDWLWPAAAGSWKFLTAGALAAATAAAVRLRWTDLELGREARLVVLASSGCLAWWLTTYEHNYYLGRDFVFDRVLLAALFVATAARPGAAGLFTVQAYLLAGQFHSPMYFTWTDKQPLFEILVLFQCSLLWVIVFRGRRDCAAFLWGAFCVTAAFYFLPGLGKVRLDWLSHNRLDSLLGSATFQNGWLWFLSDGAVGRFAALLERAGPVLQFVTLAIELGVLLMLWHRRLAVALLAACIALHAGIFAASGICFWKWAVVDAALIAGAATMSKPDAARLFGWRSGLCASALVAAAVGLGVYRAPFELAWYDAPLCCRFDLEAVGESGRVYHVSAKAMAPYDLPFAQGPLHFLSDRPKLVGCLGAIRSKDALEALRSATTVEEVDAIVDNLGERKWSEPRARRMEEFLQSYIAATRSPSPKSWLPKAVRGRPLHIWTGPVRGVDRPAYQGQEPIAEVRIRLVAAAAVEGALQVFHEAPLCAVQLEGAAWERDALVACEEDPTFELDEEAREVLEIEE